MLLKCTFAENITGKLSVTRPKYKIGQRVRISQAKSRDYSADDSSLGTYAGQYGVVNDFFSLTKGSEIFYIYNVQIGDKQEAVLHEDELESFYS